MRVKRTILSRPWAFYNTIHLPNDVYYLGEDDEMYIAKYEHEKVHIEQQGSSLLGNIFWVIRYFLSAKFRLRVETEAFVVELRNRKLTSDIKSMYINEMVNDYRGAFKYSDAIKVVYLAMVS